MQYIYKFWPSHWQGTPLIQQLVATAQAANITEQSTNLQRQSERTFINSPTVRRALLPLAATTVRANVEDCWLIQTYRVYVDFSTIRVAISTRHCSSSSCYCGTSRGLVLVATSALNPSKLLHVEQDVKHLQKVHFRKCFLRCSCNHRLLLIYSFFRIISNQIKSISLHIVITTRLDYVFVTISEKVAELL